MATLKLWVENNIFVKNNTHYIDKMSEKVATGNHGWKVVLADKAFTATAEKEYSDGIHKLIYTVNSKTQKLILTVESYTGERKEKTIFQKRCNWNGSGLIGLQGGYLDERRPYIREKEFQDFLERWNITQFIHADPNGKKITMERHQSGHGHYSTIAYTDGALIFTSECRSEFEGKKVGNACYDIAQDVEIEDSNYLLVRKLMHYEDNHNVCNTLTTLLPFKKVDSMFKKYSQDNQLEKMVGIKEIVSK